MPRLRTILEWLVILIPVIVLGFVGYNVLSGTGLPGTEPSGLPGNGIFYQLPISPPQVFEKTAGTWHFTLTSNYSYTLAGKIVGRHEYPDALPEGIIPLDIAVVNGDLLRPESLQYFTFTMNDHTLKYSYNIPTYVGLTEEYIDEHISNNHLVFLDPALERSVKNATVGECMIIKGNLVDIKGDSPSIAFVADTSTVRNDSYPEGCEIILVRSFTPVSCGN